jgi:hypothetical protein
MTIGGAAKGFVGAFIALLILTAIVVLGSAFLGGTTTISLWVTEWLLWAFCPTFGIALFILSPLALIAPTRVIAAWGFAIAAFVFGGTIWIFALSFAYLTWGFAGVFVGLAICGIGVVLVAIVSMIFHGAWLVLSIFAALIMSAIGCAAFSACLAHKSEERTERLAQL